MSALGVWYGSSSLGGEGGFRFRPCLEVMNQDVIQGSTVIDQENPAHAASYKSRQYVLHPKMFRDPRLR